MGEAPGALEAPGRGSARGGAVAMTHCVVHTSCTNVRHWGRTGRIRPDVVTAIANSIADESGWHLQTARVVVQ